MSSKKIPVYIKIILVKLFFLIGGVALFAQNSTSDFVKPTDENIHISGSNYIYEKDNELVIHRHSDKVYEGTKKTNLFNPVKARTSAGIQIEFKTDSPKVIAKFRIAEGLNSHPIFSVFQNEIFIEDIGFKYESNKVISVEIDSKSIGKEVLYKITFPLKTDVHFLGLKLKNGHQLIELEPKEKPIYVAFGDSITHGTGQKTTPQTYAYQIAEMFGYELFNLAVGGGKTSQVMAEMIADDFKHIDVMTILIGFNDYNGEGVTTKAYQQRYENILKTIRSKHPNTKIYCITLAYTTQQNSKRTEIPAEDFRSAVRNIVSNLQKNGDKNIYLIEGEKISSEKDLKDRVHFSIDGAKHFADKLYLQMNN